MKLLKRESYQSDLTDEVIFHAALKGVLRKLSPPTQPELLELWSSEEDKPRAARVTGEAASIGVAMAVRRGWLTISDVLPNGPAEEAGLKVGDRVLAIDGEALAGKRLPDAEAMIHRPSGSKVVLNVLRGERAFDVPLTTRKVRARDVRGELVRGKGVLRILFFSETALGDLGEETKALRAQGARAFVFDVRGVPGGVFDVGRLMACRFLPKGATPVFSAGRDRELKPYPCDGGGDASTPLAVLVDADTASSAEIFATALHENARAKLVGAKTKGSGAIKTVGRLANGWSFTYITDVLYGPKGDRWLEHGLAPDIEAPMDAERIESSREEPDVDHRLAIDTQLAAALAALP